MRTPAGKECKYFYGDYYRGRKREECRLLNENAGPSQWTPDLCKTCPVPDVLAANACPHMVLRADVVRQYIVFGRKVRLSVYCTRSEQNVREPHIGCGQCHPLPDLFTEKSETQ